MCVPQPGMYHREVNGLINGRPFTSGSHTTFHPYLQATQPSISPSVLRNTKPPLGPGYLDVAATA